MILILRWSTPKQLTIAILILLNLFLPNTTLFALEKDQIENNYQRIISLAPHVTEMLYSAGAGDKLVGVVKFSDYPPEALKYPIIGGYNGLNIEAIISLKPDVVIGWKEGNQKADLERLQSVGIEVWATEVKSLEDIPKQIRQFGAKLGTEKTAHKVASELETELIKVKQHYQERSEVSAYYQVWNKPFITISDHQFIGQAIKLCGGKNAFHDLPLLSAEVGLETIVHKNPDVILLGGLKPVQQSWYNDWQKWPMVSAVKNNHIYKLNADHFQRPSARLITALEGLCKKIDQAR